MPGRSDDRNPTLMVPQFVWPRLTPAVKALLIGMAAIHVATFVLFLASDALYARLVVPLMLDPGAWSAAFPFVPAWQLATHGLLHAPQELMHLLGNLLILYFFGTMLEEELGARRFLIVYASAQLAGAAAYLLSCWLGMGSHPALGASGACYGVMIAVATLHPRQIVYLLFLPIQMRWLALLIVALTLSAALVQMKGIESGTAHLAHLGGIVYGFLAVRTGLVRKDPIQLLERRRAVHAVERAAEDEARMDRLLDKIHREGMGSLTRSERGFLKRVSSRR